MYKDFLDKLNQYKKVSIYRHQRPDGDAAFSSMGLKTFIEDNFDIEVKLCGFESYERLDTVEEVSDEFIKDSLAIILDVSSPDRIDDLRYQTAKEIVVIDHHPYMLDNADLTINNSLASATCELITDIIYSDSFKVYKKSKDTCKYLYSGILTDSMGFTTSNTTSNTLYLASLLIKDGNLDVSKLNEDVFSTSLEEYEKVTKLRSKLIIEDGVGYCILDSKDLEEIGMTYDQAKTNVAEFSKIRELKIWAIFVRNPETNLYDGSLRSRRPYVINRICDNYNGGGHNNACGVKKLDENLLKSLLENLSKLAQENVNL